jgi:hypothetical protein
MIWKKLTVTWIVASLVGLYTTFVIQSLWNWFLVHSFNAPEISFWEMYGVVLLVGLLFYKDNLTEEERWKAISTTLEACVPVDKITEVQEAIKEQVDSMWYQLGISIFGKVAGTTATLAIGWAVHTFLA